MFLEGGTSCTQLLLCLLTCIHTAYGSVIAQDIPPSAKEGPATSQVDEFVSQGTMLNERHKPLLFMELYSLIVEVISKQEKCAVVFVVDDFFLPFVDVISEKNNNQDEKNGLSFVPQNFFHFSTDESKKVSEISFLSEFTSQMKTNSKNSCLHYVFMIRKKNILLEMIQSLFASSSIKLHAKVLVISGASDTSKLEQHTSQNLVQEYPLNRLINLLNIVVPLQNYSTTSLETVETETKTPFLRNILSTLVLAPSPKSTVRLNLYTHDFFRNKRRISVIYLGSWSHGKFFRGLSVEKIFPEFQYSRNWFPEKLSDFERFQLKVSTFHYPPVVIFDSSSEEGQSRSIDGLEVRLLRSLSKSLNFDFKIAVPKDGDKWGRAFPNGSWTGAIGEVMRGEADISFANHFITTGRLLLVDMTEAYRIDYTCFITPMPKPPARFNVVIWPFQEAVWATIAFTLLALPLAVAMTSVFEEYHFISSAKTSFWVIWGLLMDQSMPHRLLPRTSGPRVVVSFASLAFVALGVAYMSSLFSMLLLPSVGKPVNTLSQLLESGLEWGVRDSGGWENWFSESIDPTVKRIAQGFQFVKGIDDGISKVIDGQFAFMNSGTYLQYLVASNFTDQFGQNQLHITKECVIPFSIGIAVPKFSVYSSKFNRIIRRVVEAGLVDQWFKDLLESATKNTRKKSQTISTKTEENMSSDTRIKVLTMYDLQGAFYLLFMGYGAAVVTTVIEYICYRFEKQKSKEFYNKNAS